jgi:ABC-type lipoprotein release transport system permease subunit
MTNLFVALRYGLRALAKAAPALIPATVRVIASLLFGVATGDPATFGTILVLLLGVTLAASCVPSRRALRVNPTTALHMD